MTSSKTYTWEQFNMGLRKLPDDVFNVAMPKIREAIYTASKPLEMIAERIAYQAVPGTKPAQKTGGLRKNINRFANVKNERKAYIVIGLTPRNNAYWGWMQLQGYPPGRHSAAEKKKYATRDDLRASRQSRKIAGKDFFSRAYKSYGAAVEKRAMQAAIVEIDKVLAGL
jgi:hypothetical protein